MVQSEATASIIIGFAKRLEDDSSSFYKRLAEKFVENKAIFLSFAEEGKKNKVLIIRTYQETITDVLEACFCFKGLNLDDYIVETTLKKDINYSQALKLAIELEEKAIKFYSDIAELSKSLLATIPSAFRKVAWNRKERKLKIESLFGNLN